MSYCKQKNNITDTELRALKTKFKIGARVRLNTELVPIGTKGTVRFVDQDGNVGVEWDNGSFLVVPNENIGEGFAVDGFNYTD